MLKFAVVSLALCVSMSADAKARKRVIRLPTAKIVCNLKCRQGLELYRTMDEIAAGRLVVCGYQDDKSLWVRTKGESGECRKVDVPKGREKSQRR